MTLKKEHVTPGHGCQIGIMSVRNGYYRVCVEGEANVRLVDTGEMLQTPNLKLIKVLPQIFEPTLLSHLVNALPVIPTEDIDLGKIFFDLCIYLTLN